MKRKFQVLVADDDVSMAQFVVRALQGQNYECETAVDAHEAAEMLMKKEFDLLVSDLEMPGNEDLRLIRDLPQITAGLPVILMTGFPTVETAVKSIQLHVAAYLTKPFKVVDLLREADIATKTFQAFRAVRSSQKRTEEWNQSLTILKTRIDHVKSPDVATWETLMDLTLQNISESLQDVRTFADVVAHHKNSEKPQPIALPATGPLILVSAVRETISVLEKTKGSFKSRELGELRKRLETLVNANRG